MEQERSVTQLQPDKPPARVPCASKRAQCPAWLCHPNATKAGLQLSDSPAGQCWVFSHYAGLCAFPRCGRPVLAAPHAGVRLAQLSAKGTVPGAAWLPRGSAGRPWRTRQGSAGSGALLGARPRARTCSRARTHDSLRSLRCANKEERQG